MCFDSFFLLTTFTVLLKEGVVMIGCNANLFLSSLMHYFLLLFIFCFGIELVSQPLSILPPDSAVCAPQGVFTIQANYSTTLPNQAGTSNSLGYVTTSIPNSPSAVSGTSVTLDDDGFAGPFPIGFSFNYYGVNQTQFYISSNGYIGFNAPLPQYFNVDLSVLDTYPCNSNYPSNVIYGVFQDFDPENLNNVVKYQTLGVAPNRVLVVSFTNLPFFGTSCLGLGSTFQIKLFETSNIIQIHVSNKPVCTNLWAGEIRSGLTPPCTPNTQYICGSYGINGDDNSISNKAWQYRPVVPGTTLTPTLIGTQWSCILGNGTLTNFSSTPTTAQVNLLSASQAPKRYIIELTYSVPCGENIVLRDTFTLRLKQHNASFTATSPICLSGASDIRYSGIAAPPASASLVWNFDSGTATPGTGLGPHAVTWLSTGTKIVSLTVSGSGCASSTVSIPVDVAPAPTSDFNLQSRVCVGATAQATYAGNASSSATYSWDFDGGVAIPATGPGPFTITWNTPGVKNIRLTVSVGSCISAETIHQTLVDPPPDSEFTVSESSVCVGSPVVLSYTGLANPSAVLNWDFGGGEVIGSPPANAASFSVRWLTSGSKEISLSVDNLGCTSTAYVQNINIVELPSSEFSLLNPVCEGSSTTASYLGPEDSTASFNWVFPTGSPDSVNSVGPHTITFPTEGTYFVSLRVSRNGCNSLITQVPLVVFPKPVVSFTGAEDVCVNGISTYLFSGSADPSAIFNWRFDGGSASISNGPGPLEVNWSTPGIKTIVLSVNTAGCEAVADSATIEVLQLPDVDAGPDQEICSGNSVEIGSAPSLGYRYLWTPYDGISDSSAATTFVQLTNSTSTMLRFPLVLTADNGQCSSSDTVIIHVKPVPTVSFISPPGQCLTGNSFDFQALGSFSQAALFYWTFDSSASVYSSNASNPSQIQFDEAGSHVIELQMNDEGCQSNVFVSDVLVYPEPIADFVVSGFEGCLPFKANFTNLSLGDENQTYTWDFGIGSPSFSESPSFVYEYPGNYTVSLIVESVFGCKDTLTRINLLSVLPTPRAGFYLSEAQTEILDPEITIVNDALNADTVWYVIPYFKNFYGPDHIILFPDTGYFTIIQFVENSYGCRDTAQRIVYIRPSFRMFVPNSFTPNGDGINDILRVKGLEINQFSFTIYSRWGQQVYQSFDRENGWDGKSNIHHELIQNGVYYYKVEVVDNSGIEHKLDGWVNLIR
jgi:gliding motility-associated-like protein